MSVTPRSADLESGMGPSHSTTTKPSHIPPRHRRFTWKKLAIGAVVIVGTVWLVGPRRIRQGYSTSSPPVPVFTPPPHSSTSTSLSASPPPPAVAPGSFETDPSPSTTTQCTHPHNPTSPLVQYALTIAAGSTVSRIHIYKFNNCLSSPTLEWEVFNRTQPGLPSFASDPVEGAQSLDVLMAEAMRVVPVSLRGCAPVAVKATGGLRMLPGSQADEILRAVEERLRTRWSVFPLVSGGVGVMDGKDEGVYVWITANHLLGTLEGQTYAVLDLGGALTRIVFEPMAGDVALAESDHKFELRIAEKTHVLYQHSYLGFGLKRARARVHRLVDFMARMDNQTEIGNPCLAKKTEKIVQLDDRKVTMVGEDIGSFDACNRVIELVIAKDAICKTKPCSFNGVYQPSLLDSFPTGPVLLLSYFYDRLAPLLPSSPHTDTDAPIRLKITTIATLARQVCNGRSAWLDSWGTHPSVIQELTDRPDHCLDLTYMYALLRTGYGFEEEREVWIAKKVRGMELGWCLGATLAGVAGELRCVA